LPEIFDSVTEDYKETSDNLISRFDLNMADKIAKLTNKLVPLTVVIALGTIFLILVEGSHVFEEVELSKLKDPPYWSLYILEIISEWKLFLLGILFIPIIIYLLVFVYHKIKEKNLIRYF